MWVRAVELFECSTHKLAPGKFGEINDRIAAAGIEAGKLEEASLDEYQASLVETRTAKPQIRRKADTKGDA